MRKISAKTTTYARTEYLEEAIYSFINQKELGEDEMIIVNDYPLQKLIFDHPNVKIFNLEDTFKTIGEKDNFAVQQASGEIIATWDDDDVYMPNHLQNIRSYFTEDANMLHWKGVYYNEPDELAITGIGNSGMVYSKKAWENVHFHPIMNAGGDSVFSQKVHVLGNIVQAHPPDEEVSAWYRWRGASGNGIYHQSGQGFDDGTKPNIIERHSAHIEYLRQKGKIPTGEIHLNPHWRKPYDEMLKNHIKK